MSFLYSFRDTREPKISAKKQNMLLQLYVLSVHFLLQTAVFTIRMQTYIVFFRILYMRIPNIFNAESINLKIIKNKHVINSCL